MEGSKKSFDTYVGQQTTCAIRTQICGYEVTVMPIGLVILMSTNDQITVMLLLGAGAFS